MDSRKKKQRDGKRRFEGTNPRRKPLKVSKVVDAVEDVGAAKRALIRETKSNSTDGEHLGRLGN